MNRNFYRKINIGILGLFCVVGLLAFNTSSVFAQNINTLTTVSASADPTQSSFKVVVCDGPALPSSVTKPSNYVACDFNGAMTQIQHLIDIAMVLGVFAAIILFTYAGYLMMTGTEANRKKAKDIFPKIVWGFVIMLSAWFIVYQLLNWLTGPSSIFTKLLGNP